jgi:hypothetical protein
MVAYIYISIFSSIEAYRKQGRDTAVIMRCLREKKNKSVLNDT